MAYCLPREVNSAHLKGLYRTTWVASVAVKCHLQSSIMCAAQAFQDGGGGGISGTCRAQSEGFSKVAGWNAVGCVACHVLFAQADNRSMHSIA